MQKLVINKKTGLFSKAAKVVILDENNEIFYSYNPKGGLFNLPKGIYYTENELLQVRPLNYKIPTLPLLPKRTKLNISDFTVILTNNPHKASIYLEMGEIRIDKNFWQRINKVQREYVLSHELGHLFYVSEKQADLYAAKKMLEVGYNPSQIAFAVLNTFTPTKENLKRCEHVINNLTK